MPATGLKDSPEGALQELDRLGIAYRDVERPDSAEGLQAIMAKASKEGLQVFPLGGGTALSTASLREDVDIVLDMTGLDKIIRFDPKNLNLSLEAGVNIRAANEFLAEQDRGFFLPLDPWRAERASIGGIYASNSSGPRRQFYGTVRDLALGAGALNAAGKTVKFGGVTVKNVSGYDLTKFFIGSAGSLCVVTRVSFRILPLPDAFACCEVRLPGREAAARLLSAVRGSVLVPSALVAAGGQDEEQVRIYAGFEGHPKAVERQNRDLTTLGEDLGGTVRVESGREAMQDRIRASFNPEIDAPVRAVFKVSVPLSKGVETFAAMRRLATDQGLECRLSLLAGNGVLYVHIGYGDAADLDTWVPAMKQIAAERQGHALPVLAPAGICRRWGRRGNALVDRLVLEPIKSKLDPQGILLPLNS